MTSENIEPGIRLESGELLRFETCPCPLPLEDDLDFLRSSAIRDRTFFDVGYDPLTHRMSGLGRVREADVERLQAIMSHFSVCVTGWLRDFLPYGDDLTPDHVSLSVHEEATRSLRHSSRNDLLHIDAVPTRPTHGKRILTFSVNLNLDEPRVWATSSRFPEILELFQKGNRIPVRTKHDWTTTPRRQRFLLGMWSAKPPYDAMMARLAEFCRHDDDFQERAHRRYHHFAPGSALLLFTDAVSHAVLRGIYALEHTFIVTDSALRLPEESPLTHLMRAASAESLRKAG